MPTIRTTWIDSVSAGVLGTKVYRDDIEIADVGNGVQTYDDTTALEDTTYKYECQAYTIAGESTDEVIGVNVENITTSASGIWSIENAIYDNKSFDFSAKSTNIWSMGLAETKMYICGTDNIFQYTADQSDISQSIDDNKSGTVNYGRGQYVGKNGLNSLTASTGETMTQRNMSIPYDASTLGSIQSTFSLSGGAYGNNFRDCRWNDDGTKYWVLDVSAQKLYQFSLSIPYDLTTTTDDGSLDISPQTSTVYSFDFSADYSILIISSQYTTVFQYDLSIPEDISSATISSFVSVSFNSQVSVIVSVQFSNDGNKLFVTDTSANTIYQYSL